MERHAREDRRIAYLLAGVAGLVDATGYLESHGLFVSFMTGNSTKLAVLLGSAPTVALFAALLISCFLFGVIVATLVERVARRAGTALLLVATLLIAAGAAHVAGASGVAAALAAVAMGAINLTFRRGGEASIAIGYVTGTLVRFGQRLADAIAGARPWRDCLPYLGMWCALMAGALLGAALARTDWTVNYALAAAVITIVALVLRRRDPTGQGTEPA
ncbi:DUF1275 family protein [Sphingomonas sp. ASV193]|uniref:YoaK family protein n=1 Tax=Sphingomonas sp. ASV193 TaxID=3144405 RepID=UPI0032E8D654